jgi:hypothetical protein
MAGGWLGPLLMFWLYVWGPLRPFSYPAGDLSPHPAAFLLGFAACIMVWWIPETWFRVHRFERDGRVYERLGVRAFRRIVPDGDIANWWRRRRDPGYRIIRGRQSAAAFVNRTRQSERGHMVLFMMGVLSAVFAWRIGWDDWAVFLMAGNVAVNVYPMMLQRYTRTRLESVCSRSAA